MKKMIGHWGSRPIPRFRRNAILKIAVLIQHRNRQKPESRTLKWLIQLTFMAPRLEELIFRSAESLEDYDNPRTLEMRLVTCAQQLTEQKTVSANSNPNVLVCESNSHLPGHIECQFNTNETMSVSAPRPSNPLFMLSAAASFTSEETGLSSGTTAGTPNNRSRASPRTSPPVSMRSLHTPCDQQQPNRVLSSDWIEHVVDLFSCNQP